MTAESMQAAPLHLSDAEVDDICDGLTQDAAKVRYLKRLGLTVHRKPNGRPLVWRPAPPAVSGPEQNQPQQDGINVVGLKAWAAGRKGRNGQKAQGR